MDLPITTGESFFPFIAILAVRTVEEKEEKEGPDLLQELLSSFHEKIFHQ